ncbi:hypothetical protein [Streptomyces sp. I6]|uniref:hypothetical protein n=1 Tax=Streptomyces sp. I6 TaxID=2483113 RepID=UPI002880909E|nr:hypothetical protein [Streptomyces sp. I6]
MLEGGVEVSAVGSSPCQGPVPRRGALPTPSAADDLPLHIVWSGRTGYSLDRPKSRMTLYRTVLAEGLREDLVTLLHHRLLAEQWPVLRRLISPCIREVWENAFPELLRTAPADTTAA